MDKGWNLRPTVAADEDFLWQMLFYASPILYPASLIPKAFDAWVRYNPFAWYSERLREILLKGSGLVMGDLNWAVACLVVFAAGLWFFNRLSPSFEDFL